MLHVWAFSATVAWATEDWTVLQDEPVHVRCRDVEKGSECEAQARVGAAIQPVCDLLRDLPRWPRFFDNVSKVTVIAGHVDLYAMDFKLPWPLGTRTMVTQLQHAESEGRHEIVLESVSGDRLWTRASWHLAAAGQEVDVAYRWHTEALTMVPGWIRRTLLRRTGHHVMMGLALAAGSQPKPPPSLQTMPPAVADSVEEE